MYRFVLIQVAIFAGCGSETLSVQGEVVAVVDGVAAGFDLATRRELEELAGVDSDLYGSCRIGRDDAGETQAIVTISRPPGGEPDAIVRSFSMILDADETGRGALTAGEVLYSSGSRRCELMIERISRGDAAVAFGFDCELENSSGGRALMAGELSFRGCFVD
ncbi:MAG: hypothetical protein H6721_03370 [Sandaracinus sp.]|nr:hypothetical protein [Myxococcales bacterium]MCB9615570.1 hypothetical protein [Sandaracinus sp.]MCB9631173.1 hypothetical protein [Sandaracinus sp.]